MVSVLDMCDFVCNCVMCDACLLSEFIYEYYFAFYVYVCVNV